MPYARYGLYYTPKPGLLADFGAQWLGWDLAAGTVRDHPEIDGLPCPIPDITATPRKYGLHGTIKPPFHLTPGTTADGLHDATANLCAKLAPLTLPRLTIAQMGRFLALKIDGDQTPLAKLASTIVTQLDAFRAPPSEAELARRRKSNLAPRQEELLAQWGYPYVLDQFRFHITLSSALSPEHAVQTRDALAPYIIPLLPTSFTIDDLTLVGQDADGMFHQIHRFALTG
ncbi:DUF1045 domain-containing protein [Shimia abyssi]|uniref:Uncharacterized protein DUF1045 n=1 Tax=Shimia abyssi TaxID=1662395 RepID=A0A2P8F740_9RHOB|nr:DUF1045 domain-containing protein [Shimia abyssi]PSL17527.1 uncharacterized protein DUF1045 [Shimia abyssi]